MPVVKYQSQVQSQVTPGFKPTNQLSQQDFASPLAEGAVQVAQTAIAVKQQMDQKADITAAEEATMQFERAKNDMFFNADTGYFNTQGRNAYVGAGGATSTLEELKTSYAKDLSPAALEAYNRVVDNHITRAQSDITRHASKGLDAWEQATIQAQVENAVENASLYWNQPDKLKVQRVLGEQAVIESAQRQGLGPEVTAENLQTYRSTFAKSVIASATQESAAMGQEALDTMGELLEGPASVEMKGLIEKQTALEKTRDDSRQATLTATNLVSTYGDRKSIQDEVNKIEDPELRKRTMSESMTLFSQREQAESEERGDIFSTAEKTLIEGGTVEQWKAANPGEWDKMTSTQQKALITVSGKAEKKIETDWAAFSDLMVLPESELAEVNPSDHFSSLAEAERGKLISAVKAARGSGTTSDKIDHQVGRTRTTQTSATLEELLGKKAGWNQAEKDQANAFHAILDSEVNARQVELGRNLTSEEYTDVLNGLTRKVVIERPYWFDKKVDITDIDADVQETLSDFLIQNNIPVTADNLIKAWEQAK
jgi:hypothetical protein